MSKKMPDFKSEKEEALFWSTHSPLDYGKCVEEKDSPFDYALSLLKKASKEHRETKRLLTFRMEPSQILLAKIIANKHGDNYQSLMRRWVKEGISRELSQDPSIGKELRREHLHAA